MVVDGQEIEFGTKSGSTWVISARGSETEGVGVRSARSPDGRGRRPTVRKGLRSRLPRGSSPRRGSTVSRPNHSGLGKSGAIFGSSGGDSIPSRAAASARTRRTLRGWGMASLLSFQRFSRLSFPLVGERLNQASARSNSSRARGIVNLRGWRISGDVGFLHSVLEGDPSDRLSPERYTIKINLLSNVISIGL
jgi:hypothetical protein